MLIRDFFTLDLDNFTRAPANFTWAQARVCPGVATPLLDGFEEPGDWMQNILA